MSFRFSPKILLPVLVVVPVMVMQAFYAFEVMRSDLIFFNAQREMVYWGEEDNTPGREEVRMISSAMDQALEFRSQNPDYLALKARLQAWEGLLAENGNNSVSRFRDAAETMEKSLVARPANPYSWLQLAEYLSVLPDSEATFRQAVSKARELGPGDPSLQQRFGELSTVIDRSIINKTQ